MIPEILAVFAGWVLAGVAVAPTVVLAPRPAALPRHRRPKGWTGPAERAPFPPVVSNEARSWIYPQDVEYHELHGLSRLNREVMRRRFRVDMAAAHGRELVP